MCTLLHVTDVTKIYKNQLKFSLEHVSFHVEQSEFLGIMGASGSGNTTLLNVLMGKTKIQNLTQAKAADFRKDNPGTPDL